MTTIPQDTSVPTDAIGRAIAGFMADKELAAFDRETERTNAEALSAYASGDLRGMMKLRTKCLIRSAIGRPLLIAMKDGRL